MLVRKLFKKNSTKALEMDQISQGWPHAFRKRPTEKNLYSKQHRRHERTLHDPFPDKPI